MMNEMKINNEKPRRLSNESEEMGQISRVAFYAFVLNCVLTILKAILAKQSGSLAVTASAIDSGTDSLASLAVFGGLLLSTRKFKAFPYGLYKIENVISVVVSIFIFLAGLEIVRQSFSATWKPPVISLWVITGLFVNVMAIFLFGQYAVKTGKRTESPALIAEGRPGRRTVGNRCAFVGHAELFWRECQLCRNRNRSDRRRARCCFHCVCGMGTPCRRDAGVVGRLP